MYPCCRELDSRLSNLGSQQNSSTPKEEQPTLTQEREHNLPSKGVKFVSYLQVVSRIACAYYNLVIRFQTENPVRAESWQKRQPRILPATRND